MNEKLNIKKLKGPDAFQERMLRFLAWLKGNRSATALLLAPIVLVVFGAWVWGFISTSSKDKRLTELARIEILASEEEASAEKLRSAIQKEIDALPQPPAAKPGTPESKDPSEGKRKELTEKMIAIRADHGPSAQQYLAFFEKNKDNAEGWMAGMKASSWQVHNGQKPAAVKLLGDIVKRSVSVEFYQQQGRIVFINLLEDTGDLDGALKESETLVSLADDYLKPQALLIKGRLLMNRQQKEEAKAVFDQILDKHSTAPEAEKARGYKALL